MPTTGSRPITAITESGAGTFDVSRPRVVGIVDDDVDVRDSLKFLLESANYAVVTFASAAQLLAWETQRLVCLILDHHMPQMTGLQLAEKLRADGVGVPIMLITGSLASELPSQASALGIRWVREKPISERDLLDFINAALA
jgi:two-component system, LuxR family, response regulator FixJ